MVKHCVALSGIAVEGVMLFPVALCSPWTCALCCTAVVYGVGVRQSAVLVGMFCCGETHVSILSIVVWETKAVSNFCLAMTTWIGGGNVNCRVRVFVVSLVATEDDDDKPVCAVELGFDWSDGNVIAGAVCFLACAAGLDGMACAVF